jgi:hypothetical protein
MTSFHFRLQKVLDWRRTRLALEEANYRRHAKILANIDRQDAELAAAAQSAERQVRAWNPLAGLDLDALDAYRLRTKNQRKELAATRTEAVKRLAAQQAQMLDARRKVRLLERLKERRLADWQAAFDQEIEQTAAESYLAQWRRRPTPPSP